MRHHEGRSPRGRGCSTDRSRRDTFRAASKACRERSPPAGCRTPRGPAQPEEKASVPAGGAMRDDDPRDAPEDGRIGGPEQDRAPRGVRRARERQQRPRSVRRGERAELQHARRGESRREQPKNGRRRRFGAAAAQKAGERQQKGEKLERGARPGLDAAEGEGPENRDRVEKPLQKAGGDARHHAERFFGVSEST